jgi:hypothetical protein
MLEPSGAEKWARMLRFPRREIPGHVRDSIFNVAESKAEPHVERARARGSGPAGSLENAVERALGLPRHYPPIEQAVFGTDGTIWLKRMTGVPDGTWLVLDSDGAMMYHVQISPGIEVQQATATSIWGTAQDKLGVAYVVRLNVVVG